jgi:hypothetical protein
MSTELKKRHFEQAGVGKLSEKLFSSGPLVALSLSNGIELRKTLPFRVFFLCQSEQRCEFRGFPRDAAGEKNVAALV